jgi:4-amino-4-deoxy-L-arabinose transferase-like glycosyltransferase
MERLTDKHPLVCLILIWFLFIALPIGNRGLWAPDEPRYAQVAWEMSQSKSFLIPIMNAEIYAEKPPLFFWLTILAGKIVSFENASRWVSAFASLGTLLLTYYLGLILGNRKIGLTAALILMTSSLSNLLMSTGNIDTTLTFFTTLSLFLFIRWALEGRVIYLFFAYVACGLGILTKGPVALVLPWLAYVVWEISKLFRREKASFLYLLWGPFVALAVAAVWVIPACIAGGEEYTRIILLKQQVGRAIQAYVHRRPWYEYLLVFPPNALPWCVVLVGAIPELKNIIKGKNRLILFYAIWFCAIFIFFSLVSSKRERYLLPIYPVFSLLLAHVLSNWTAHRETSISLKIAAIITMVGALVLLVFPILQPFLKNSYPVLKIFRVSAVDWRLWALFILGIAAAGIIRQGLKLVKEKHHLTAGQYVAVGFLLVASIGQVYYIPYIDPVKSARQASKTIQNLLPQAGTVAFYRRRFDNGWNFYLDKAKIPIITDDRIKRAQPRYDVIILREKHLNLLKAVLNMDHYRIAAIEPVGSKRFVLLKYNRN